MARYFLAVPIALLFVLILFSFMAWMVDSEHHNESPYSKTMSFTMFMTENEQDIRRRQRSQPKQPKMPQVPKPSAISEGNNNVIRLNAIAQPTLALDTDISGVAISAPVLGAFIANQQALPLYRIEPNYPMKALKRQIEGYVIMKFTIGPTGKPIDIEVVEAEPKRLFEREARKALRKWKYQPKIMDGRAIAQPNQKIKLEFQIAK